MVKSAEFRARARAQLQGNIFSNLWLMAVVAMLVHSAIMGVASYLWIAALLLEGFLMYGIAKIFLSLARGGNTVDLADLFAGKDKFADLLLLSLFKNLFLLLWALIPIAGIFIAAVKSLSYSMIYYIKYDHPEYDWKTCINESRKIMNGNKWRLYCLSLSFIGWMILGALCLGIGTLWVQAYMMAAQANFYEEIRPKVEVATEQEPTANENV